MNHIPCKIFFTVALLLTVLTSHVAAEGDIIFTQPVMGVIFSHAVHVDDNGLDCESCHDALFEMEALKVQEKPDFTMQGLSEGNYCGACHDGDMAFDSDSRCASCHIGVIGHRRAMGTNSQSVHR